MPEQLKETLNQRGQQYGDFAAVAQMSQDIRAIFMGYLKNNNPEMLKVFRPYMAEAVQMIGTKLARIACGNSFNADSWHDIAGYAQLAADNVTREIEMGIKMAEAQRQANEQAVSMNIDGEEPEDRSCTQEADPVGVVDSVAMDAEGKAGESSVMAEHTHGGPVELHEATVDHGEVKLEAPVVGVTGTIDIPTAPVVESVVHTQPTPHSDGNI